MAMEGSNSSFKATAGLTKYYREVKAELKKVVWPTFAQLRKHTTVVLVAILLVGAVIAALDWVFSKGLAVIMGVQ